VNADRRPIPAEILAAVAEGAMPLAVFADWLEQHGYTDEPADELRRFSDYGRVTCANRWCAPGQEECSLHFSSISAAARCSPACYRLLVRCFEALRP
jgi:hypothetical protein